MSVLIDPFDPIRDARDAAALAAMPRAPHPDSPLGRQLRRASERHEARKSGATGKDIERVLARQTTARNLAKQTTAQEPAQPIGPRQLPPGVTALVRSGPRPVSSDASRGRALEVQRATMGRPFSGVGTPVSARPAADAQTPVTAAEWVASQRETAERGRAGTERALKALAQLERARREPAVAVDPAIVTAMAKARRKAAKRGETEPRREDFARALLKGQGGSVRMAKSLATGTGTAGRVAKATTGARSEDQRRQAAGDEIRRLILKHLR